MEPITNSQTYPKVVSPGSKHIHNWFVTVFSSLVASVGSTLFPRVVGPRLRLVRADLMISRLLRSGSISSYPAGLLPWVAVLSGTWTKQERSNEVFLLLFCILHLHVLGLLRSVLSMDSVSTGLHIENVGPGERNLCWALKDGVLMGHWSWSHANTGQMWHIVTHFTILWMEILQNLHAFRSWRPTLFEATVTVSCQWQSWPQWQLALSRTKLYCTFFLIRRT